MKINSIKTSYANKPELVLPAGSLEKLKTAVDFGADAVYLGGKEFSLRAFAGNLTLSEIEAGLSYARHRHKKVYITVNVLARNQDLKACLHTWRNCKKCRWMALSYPIRRITPGQAIRSWCAHNDQHPGQCYQL
jgi:collagenase-like PrtC family protease